ncbi:hypothetical protein [Gordonia westfalica]|uniref:Uncharacterized protein n=1 Tax=Gordonia westfalica TaxID=158898 RepID=A0A1H2JTP6_9ACTN|nr:hypothetical protein [Gordonia westfalica]SDU59548.1 hypothetical protein SAMN04488548_1342476 [Gordonia westfalica]
MTTFGPAAGTPEHLTWTDTAYASYVAEICAIGLHLRKHLFELKLARPRDRNVKPGRQLAQAVLELGQNSSAWRRHKMDDNRKLGPLADHTTPLLVHPNGFINTDATVIVDVASLDRNRRWDRNPRLVVPKKAISGYRASWYDPADIIEFSRASILPINIALPDLVARDKAGDFEASRFVNSTNVVVATDIGKIGHVWDFRRLTGDFQVGRQIGSSDYYFESLPSYYGRVLAREVIAAERATR